MTLLRSHTKYISILELHITLYISYEPGNGSSSLKWIHSQYWQKKKWRLKSWCSDSDDHFKVKVTLKDHSCLCWQHPTLWKSDLQIYSKYSQEKISKISFIRKLGRIKILCIREIRVKTFTFLNEIFFYLAYKPQVRARWSHSSTKVRAQNGLWPPGL